METAQKQNLPVSQAGHHTLKPVFLTFDDGPLEPFTSEILDILKQYGAKATFFVCGKNALKFPELVKRMAAEGHAVGNHTYSHSWAQIFFGGQKREVLQTADILKNLTGRRAFLYRSPWGLTMPWMKRWLKKQGFTVFRWDVAAFDWWQPSANFMANRILNRLKPGGIILLHDGNKTLASGSRQKTAEALRLLLPELKKRYFECKNL